MKNSISILFVLSLFSLSLVGQNSRFHADNNVKNISLNNKTFKKDPIKYFIVEKLGYKLYIMPLEDGESEIPFQIAFYKDLEKQSNLSSGKQEMVATKVFIAKLLTNCNGKNVDKLSPKGLIAEKRKRKAAKLYIESGDYMYKSPERLVVNGVEYFLFKGDKVIRITPIDEDINDNIAYDTKKVSFINEDNFYVFEGVDVKKEWDELDCPTTKQVTSSTNQSYRPSTTQSYRPIYYIVQKGENLTVIANKYSWVTVDKLKMWNHLKSSKILSGQKLTIIR